MNATVHPGIYARDQGGGPRYYGRLGGRRVALVAPGDRLATRSFDVAIALYRQLLKRQARAIAAVPLDKPLPAGRANCVNRPGCYVLEDPLTGLWKIGSTGAMRQRMGQHATSSPSVRLIGFIATETRAEARVIEERLHVDFQCCHVQLEWFDLSDAQQETVRRLLREGL